MTSEDLSEQPNEVSSPDAQSPGSREGFDFLCSALIGLGVVAALMGTTRIWGIDGPVLWSASSQALVVIGPLIVLAFLFSSRSVASLTRPEGYAFALVFVFFSDWLTRPFSLLQGPSIRGPMLLAGMVLFCGLASKRLREVLPVIASILPVLIAINFFANSGGELLFSDDHPVNLFRLKLLTEKFPSIPFYSPLWNSGLDVRDFFATGILNVYFLFLPLFAFFEPEQVFNLIVATVVFLLPPVSVYLSGRVLRFDKAECALAALFAAAISLEWFRWGLKYGTLGFCTSMVMSPIAFALALRLLDASDKKFARKHYFALFASLSLTLFWSISFLIFLPLLFVFLWNFRFVWRERALKRFVVAMLALHIPWSLLFIEASNPFGFVKMERAGDIKREEGLLKPRAQYDPRSPDRSSAVQVRGLKNPAKNFGAHVSRLRELSHQANPALLLLIVPGLFLIRSRMYQLAIGVTLLWLASLSTVLVPSFPQLELERFFLPMLLLSTLLAGRTCYELIVKRSAIARALGALVFAFAFSAAISAANVSRNSSWERFQFANSDTARMIDAIAENAGEGRVVFPGFMLHQFWTGHIAPLVLWTQQPMVASSPFHNLWWHFEFVPKQFFAEGFTLVEPFLDSFNASSIVVHSRKWKRYARQHPEKYQLKASIEQFEIYERQDPPGYFKEGSGEILEQGSDRLTLRANSENITLRARHFYFLDASSCQLSAVRDEYGTELIRLEDCEPGDEIVIQSCSPFERLRRGLLSW